VDDFFGRFEDFQIPYSYLLSVCGAKKKKTAYQEPKDWFGGSHYISPAQIQGVGALLISPARKGGVFLGALLDASRYFIYIQSIISKA
jgi:hypothetical protein